CRRLHHTEVVQHTDSETLSGETSDLCRDPARGVNPEHLLERGLHRLRQAGNGRLHVLLTTLETLDYAVSRRRATCVESLSDVLPGLISVLLVVLPGSDVRLALRRCSVEEGVRHVGALVRPGLSDLLDDRSRNAHVGQLLELACEGLHPTDVHLHGLRGLTEIRVGLPLAVLPRLEGTDVELTTAEEAGDDGGLDSVQLLGLVLGLLQLGIDPVRLAIQLAEVGLELPCR